MTTEEKKNSATPFDAIAECLPKVDFNSLGQLNYSVKTLLQNPKYGTALSNDSCWEWDCNDITDVSVTWVYQLDGSPYELAVEVHYGHSDDKKEIRVPVKYLINKEALEQAVIASEAEKNRNRKNGSVNGIWSFRKSTEVTNDKEKTGQTRA